MAVFLKKMFEMLDRAGAPPRNKIIRNFCLRIRTNGSKQWMLYTIIIIIIIHIVLFLIIYIMEFLESIKLYSNKPTNSLVNTAVTKPETINWNERLQTIRRTIIDQLSRLKIEEVCLRNLALKNEQTKRTHSTISVSTTNNENQQDLFGDNRKRFCTLPSSSFDVDSINNTDLDLEP